MKHKKTKFPFILFFLNELFWLPFCWSDPILFPFQTLQKFKLTSETSQSEPEVFLEHIVLSKNPSTFWSLPQRKWIFVEELPKIDRCGIVHFPLRVIGLNQNLEEQDPEWSDLYCVPNPFPRCTSTAIPKNQGIRAFLIEKLELNAQCRMEIYRGSQIMESYEIQSESSSSD